jgi:glycosyltransferase involved in cell wall biosynthesis
LKPLLINTYDTLGGAAKAASRLLNGLNDIGITAKMIVQEQFSDDPHIISPYCSRYQKAFAPIRSVIDLQPLYTLYPRRRRSAYSLNWLPERAVRAVNARSPDIVNLHWINAGFVRLGNLRKINAPIIWTIHDMWPFTGGCHYSGDCEKFSRNCGSCPVLKSTRDFDLSRIIWLRKRRAWKKLNMTIVSPSRWLAGKASKSSLFSRFPIEVIPNGLDTDRFRPIDPNAAREILGLPNDKTILLFGGIKPFDDPRKGFSILQPVLNRLKKSYQDHIQLAVFGTSCENRDINRAFKVFYLDYLFDEATLSMAYSAADVFLAPSLQDNLPNTVMESLSCGTPCVAFDVGGMVDLIQHKKNGYVARPFDQEDFTHGIVWVIENADRLERLSQYAREFARNKFNVRKQAERYHTLFNKILS